MEKKDIVKYWKETSDRDYETMIHLFQSKDFHWSLFIGHLVIEKLLKAIFVINNDHNIVPPKTHDLLLLAKKAGIETNDEINDMLDFVTTFNINARYPDYKQEFYRKCTMKFTQDAINKIKELRQWLLSMIGNQYMQ